MSIDESAKAVRVKSWWENGLKRPYLPYVFPFILFAVISYGGYVLDLPKSLVYPAMTMLVAVSLYLCRKSYREEVRFSLDWLSILAGFLVFAIWILPEGLYPKVGHSEFNPYAHAKGYGVYALIGFRLIGAVLVVPLMEELLWRSFALRFLINSHFKSVPLGQFSWFSFVVVSIAFGFEHHRWLVGILAGMVYAGLLYRSRNLFSPILSHAVTNLLLGTYVLITRRWSFW